MISPLSIQSHVRALESPGLPQPIAAPVIPGQQPVTPTRSFGEILNASLGEVNTQMVRSDQMVSDLAAGKSDNLHGTLIAMQKADISFRAVLEVRNKVMRAYEEIMRMQI